MDERILQVTAFTGDTTERNTSYDDEQPPPRWGKHLKSGINRTGASTLLHAVTWPHEVVYNSDGKPATYQDLSIPVFEQGYLIIMDIEDGLIKKQMAAHLQDLMSDAQLYGWERARTFHSVWLN